MSSTNNPDIVKCERAVRLMNSRRHLNQKQAATEAGVNNSLLQRFEFVTKFDQISTLI